MSGGEGGFDGSGRDERAGSIVDGNVGDVILEGGEAGGDGVRSFDTAIDAGDFFAKVVEPFEALGWGDDDDLGDFFKGGKSADAVPKDRLAVPLGGELIKAHPPRGTGGDDDGGEAHLGEVLHDLL